MAQPGTAAAAALALAAGGGGGGPSDRGGSGGRSGGAPAAFFVPGAQGVGLQVISTFEDGRTVVAPASGAAQEGGFGGASGSAAAAAAGGVGASHAKGCNCRKSHCLKKYCECFQASIPCSGKCRCLECRNAVGELLVEF